MDRDDERFVPEAVDEQLERLSRDSQHTALSSDTSSLLHDLHSLYKEDARRLEQIWGRLTTHKHQKELMQQPVDIQSYRQRKLQQQQSSHPLPSTQRSKFQRIGIFLVQLVAVLIIAASLFITTFLGTHEHQPAHPHIRQAITPDDFYMSSDQGVVRVNGKTGKEVWQYRIPHYSLGLPVSPLVTNDLIFTESQDSLYAIDATTGTLRWSHTFSTQISPYPPIKARPVLIGHTIYVSVVFMDVYAFNVTDGAFLHRYSLHLNTNIVAIAVENNMLYATGLSDICEIDLSSGKQLWHQQLGASQTLGIPHIVNNTLYIVSSDDAYWPYVQPNSTSFINAFNTATGQLLWQSPKIQGTATDITIANSIIYNAATDGSISAYAAQTGTILWQKTIAGESFSGFAPQLNEGSLYLVVKDPKMYYAPIGMLALDLTTNTIRWQYPATLQEMRSEGHTFESPVIEHGVIYVNDAKNAQLASEIYAINSNGTVIWHIPIN